jgi:aqualysin 1
MLGKSFLEGDFLLTKQWAATFAAATMCALTGIAGGAGAAAADPGTGLAPLVGRAAGSRAGHYIVVLKGEAAGRGSVTKVDRESAPALRRLNSAGVRVDRRFRHALNGFTAQLDADRLAEVRADPGVAYVSRDGEVHGTGSGTESPVPSWGLDRIDQRQGKDNSYGYPGTGAGVTAYVVDSGLRASHSEFTGRTAPGFAARDDGYGTTDCNGHGTHVAGTLGGTRYGVAKAVTIVPVRVLGCDNRGVWSDSITGIDWVTANRTGPAVINFSVGGDPDAYDTVVEDTIARAISSGITFVTSAGNKNLEACRFTPARLPQAITVGALDSNDSRADYSNYGSCVDLFAPGSGITSASYVDDTASADMSGTSMASPHVAGVAAVYLETHRDATPAQVTSAILADASSGLVANAGSGSPNRLLYQAPTGTPDPGVTPTVTPSPTVTTTPVVPTGLKAQRRSFDTNPNDNALRPGLQLTNSGSSDVPLSSVTMRYWFTRDGASTSYLTACDYAVRDCANVRTRVVELGSTRTGADSYLEVGFTDGAGRLAAGATTGQLQLRVHKAGYTNFSESNDYSWTSSQSFADSARVTVYVNGQLAWGTEP